MVLAAFHYLAPSVEYLRVATYQVIQLRVTCLDTCHVVNLCDIDFNMSMREIFWHQMQVFATTQRQDWPAQVLYNSCDCFRLKLPKCNSELAFPQHSKWCLVSSSCGQILFLKVLEFEAHLLVQLRCDARDICSCVRQCSDLL